MLTCLRPIIPSIPAVTGELGRNRTVGLRCRENTRRLCLIDPGSVFSGSRQHNRPRNPAHCHETVPIGQEIPANQGLAGEADGHSNSRYALGKARKSASIFSSLRSETLAISGSLDWTSPRIRAVLVSRRRMQEQRALSPVWCRASRGARPRILVRPIMEHRLMARSPKNRLKSSRRSARAAAIASAPVQSAPRPGGKLGLIVERLSARAGATADELVEATGWQRHSVLGALSRLRSRGCHAARCAPRPQGLQTREG
jgi:hypothetical protein